jgi:Ca2+-binding RTX toxin-like protein
VRSAVATLTVACSLLSAAPALGANVTTQDPARWVRVTANDGETNRITVSAAASVVTVSDEGADLLAGSGCEQVAAREVRCALSDPKPRVDVALGDGDDEATALGGLPAKLEGEGGNDVLTGGDADDDLDGGDGIDRLSGGAGVDSYDGGEGDDAVAARDSLRETVACGGGHDAGDADLEDEVAADCEGVVKPLPPAGLDEVQPADSAPGSGSGAPAPVPGRSVALAVKTGAILVRPPGSVALVPLDPAVPVPVGTLIDARKGTVSLTSASDLAGATQAADFTGARFRVAQVRGAAMVTELQLNGGNFSTCPRPRARAAVARAASRRVVRRLWGSGKGRFRTRGRNSAATVRGTVWTVEDRCDGTLTRVTEGVVVVQTLRTGRTKVVRAGQSYLVRRPARR